MSEKYICKWCNEYQQQSGIYAHQKDATWQSDNILEKWFWSKRSPDQLGFFTAVGDKGFSNQPNKPDYFSGSLKTIIFKIIFTDSVKS